MKNLLLECFTDLETIGLCAFPSDDLRQKERSLPFSVIACGSLGKAEACPYSDIEMFNTTDNELPAPQQRCHQLVMQLFQIKVAVMGETIPIKNDHSFPDGTSREGISFDTVVCRPFCKGRTYSHSSSPLPIYL